MKELNPVTIESSQRSSTKVGQPAPLSTDDVNELLQAKILLGGARETELVFLKTMLKLSGFTRLYTAVGEQGILSALREAIDVTKNNCDIDLVLLDSNLTHLSTSELRLTMDKFDEWRLIPIIALVKQTQWDSSQVLTDLGHGVTSLLYRPLTAESLSPTIMTAVAVKKERDLHYQRQIELEEENASLKVMEARLQFSVSHDDLTGLANRRRLEQALEMCLHTVRQFQSTSVLFYIDLDSFKVLNDAEGHEAGDALLVEIANSLRRFFKVQDTLVRIGSDEFAVLVNHIDRETALLRAEGLRTLFDGYSFQYHGAHYHLSASIGLKFIVEEETAVVGEILSHANQACYTAKKRGRNRVHVYSQDDREMHTLRHSVEWAPRIREALKNGNFFFEYQPIYQLSSQFVNHYECLIRMRGEGDTIYYPKDFISVAEDMGLIQQIDFWVVSHAFDLAQTLPETFSLAVNLSGKVFMDENLYPLVLRKLQETHVTPSRILFEITETSAISNFDKTQEMVIRLRELGCRFALDDFGAGFNSYNYLKYFPVDVLKIDGAFIKDLDNDPTDQLLVKSMIDIARSLGKKTVAEFVERQSTLRLLKSYGVDFAQGYLIGKPQADLPTQANEVHSLDLTIRAVE